MAGFNVSGFRVGRRCRHCESPPAHPRLTLSPFGPTDPAGWWGCPEVKAVWALGFQMTSFSVAPSGHPSSR